MNDKLYTSFLGTGWGFPPTFEKSIAGVEMISDEEDIKSSLQILLSTSIGERFMQPQYGCNMNEMVFESLNVSAKTYLQNKIKRAIMIYEPRITLKDVILDTQFEFDGRIDIIIEYTVRTTNSRYNLVFPFYLEEANSNTP